MTMADAAGRPPEPPGKPWSSESREELAAAVRRLMELTVTSTAGPELLADTARSAASLAAALERHVPESGPVPITRFTEHPVETPDAATLAASMPFDVVIGRCNPVAPPITIEFEPPKAIGRVEFTPTYEGAPGCVHGAALAGAFDIMLTAANVIARGAGPTVNLSIRYRRPTLIGQPTLFESWVTEQDDRRTHSRGHLIQNGTVCVEAVGEFVNMERARITAMHRRRPGPGPAAPPPPGGAAR
jgi:acyl-coenzyme A thioesterase PaaI-like protein